MPKVGHRHGHIAQLVDKPPRKRRGKPLADFGIARHPRQLVQLLGRSQQLEPPFPPERDDLRGDDFSESSALMRTLVSITTRTGQPAG